VYTQSVISRPGLFYRGLAARLWLAAAACRFADTAARFCGCWRAAVSSAA
jgi:hypothetical protein